MNTSTQRVVRKEIGRRRSLGPLPMLMAVLAIILTFIVVGSATNNFLTTGHFSVPRNVIGSRRVR